MSKTAHKEKDTALEATALVAAPEAAANLPAVAAADDLSADAGQGLQNITANDLATPLLSVLQSNSPQVKRSDGKYLQGAIEGCIFNNVTNTFYDGNAGIIVVPVFYERVHVEWKPNRGGFVASHAVDTPLKDQVKMTEVTGPDGGKKFVPLLPSGNILTETANHYVLVVSEDGSFEPAMIPMASSQLKSSRVWNSLMSKLKLKKADGSLFTPASFFMSYRLTTKVRTKDTNSWFVWNVEAAEPTRPLDKTTPLYESAKQFERAVASGKVKAKMDETAEAAHTAVAPAAEAEDDSIPF